MSLLSDPVVSDEALVLRWFPVTDTSRVVVWFTARHGRISTLIKGSQRPKSWLLGQYDLFYTCELLFYAKANEDLHMIRECAPLAPRSGLRQNWRACAAASFVADLLYRISPPWLRLQKFTSWLPIHLTNCTWAKPIPPCFSGLN